MLDDSRLPIDKEVFMRMLSYYEISRKRRARGAPAETNAAQPALRRKEEAMTLRNLLGNVGCSEAR
jgi:hypothetical protein